MAFSQVRQALAAERLLLQHQKQTVEGARIQATAARAHAVELEHQLDVAQQRHDVASTSCDKLLALFLHEFFVAIPDDILVLIFQEVIATYEHWECGFMMYELERSCAPFRLAAVCRRWWRVAITTSVLWIYIAINDQRPMASALSRTHLLASRSRQAPVDIVLSSSFSHQAQYVEIDDADAQNNLLEIVVGMSHRWHRVEWTSYSAADYSGFEALRGPTPLLVTLYIEPCGEKDMEAPTPELHDFLPHAPNLTTLRMASPDTTSIWRICYNSFQSLTTLTWWEQGEKESTLHTLRVVQSTIRELNLGTIVTKWLEPPTDVMKFPRLEVLSIRDMTWALSSAYAWSSKSSSGASPGLAKSRFAAFCICNTYHTFR